MEYNYIEPYPENFTDEKDKFLCGTSVLLGPPSIGKSYFLYNSLKGRNEVLFVSEDRFLNNFRNEINFERGDILSSHKSIDISSFDTIVVDDLYKVITKTVSVKNVFYKLHEFIKGGKNIILSTTPYRWEWTYARYNKHKAFSEIIQNANINLCKVEQRRVRESLEEFPEKKIKNLKKLSKRFLYKFEFKKAVDKQEKKKYETYILPHNVLYDMIFSFYKGGVVKKGAFNSEQVEEIMKESLQDIALAVSNIKEKWFSESKNALQDLLGHLQFTVLPLSFVMLAIDVYMEGSGKNASNTVSQWFQSFNRFGKHELEMIESRKNLPPLSLINSKEMMLNGKKE
ncbi:MAG: hypothetical protein DRN33_00090, partial [Thermoplasmata archaeon]